MEVTVKAFLQTPLGETEVRRISMTLNQDTKMFQVLTAEVAAAFPDLKGRSFSLSWQDSDKDYIIMSSDEELQDALSQVSSGILRVFISDIDECQDQGHGEEMLPEQNDWNQEEISRHDIEMPPMPIFRGRGGCGLMRGGRGRHHSAAGPFSGPRGGHFHGPRGAHFHGPRGPFHGHRGPFQGFSPFPWNAMPEGSHEHPYFAGLFANDEHNPGMSEKKHWKKALRDSVPVSHRRWAKIYIHNWRNQNLSNATTTSSDSERECRTKALTKEAAGVPEAYVVWLDMILPRFHQHWEEQAGDPAGLDADDRDSLATLRMSVPVEFREWTWWFLRKRYGKRFSPKIRKCSNQEAGEECEIGWFGKENGHCPRKRGCGKGKWDGVKLGSLAKRIPHPVRLWAKHLIFTWQLEQQVPLVRPQMSDSEDIELDLQMQGVPEDYGKWLLKFLPHWHARRGLLDPSKVDRTAEEKANLKATVPQEFRDWVKCYLAKNLKNQQKTELSTEHNQWIEVFKRKWLQQQESSAKTDSLWASSSEDDAVSGNELQPLTSDPDTDVDVSSTFKRMKLDGNKKSVHFDESASDTDASNLWGKKPGPGFRRFAKNHLAEWDGISITDAADDADIPPHVHRWLCRMMIKMEEKKMRQMKKAAKRETKLARKELKSIEKLQKQNQA